MSGTPIVTVEALTKSYGRAKVLNNVSFSLEAGTITALLGPNGAGKTTTLKCMLGVTDFRGQVRVAGHSSARAGKAVRRLTGYVPQSPAFSPEDTCREALRFLADLRGVAVTRIGELLEKVGLKEQRDTRVSQLSGGMRQRLALAAALLSDPPLLLLDEPTANLDVESRLQFRELLMTLRDEGKTIVLSTHFVEHIADIADRVILLSDGAVALDMTPHELQAGAGGHFAVHTNGTAKGDLVAALAEIGIGAEKIMPMAGGLDAAIQRELNRRAEEGLEAR